MNSKIVARVAAGLMGVALLASAQAQPDVKRRNGPPVNEAGQPVKASNGQRITYTKAQWKAPARLARPVARAGLGTPQTGVIPSWNYVAYGAYIGSQGLVSAQVGGVTELYATAMGNYWYALQGVSQTLSEGLKQTFASELYASGIARLVLARGPAGDQRIVVALNDGTIVQYDAVSKQIVDRAAGPCTGHGDVQAFAAGDLDGNGVDEFAEICGDNQLVVHGPGYTTWWLADVGGTDLVIAQMDNDASMEIASTSGKIVDASTKSVQWTRAGGFGAHLVAGDIDGDGRAELIAADYWYYINAYDVEKKLPKWTLQMELDIGAIQLADITGDGIKELLVGDGQWGSVHAFNPLTRAEIGSISNPEHGVTNILVADVNGDGTAELMWGAGATSSGEDHLYVSSWADKQIQWANMDLTGPFVGPVSGDLDGDGVDEIVFVSRGSNADYDSGRIIVLDGKTLAVRGVSDPIVNNGSWTGTRDIRLADLDGKGRKAILVAADSYYDGALEAYKFSRKNVFTRVVQVIDNGTSTFDSVAAADLDGNGKVELIGGSSGYIHAYDAATGAKLWTSPVYMGGSARDLLIGDFDADGGTEFASISYGGNPYVHDGSTHEVEAIIDAVGTCLAPLQTLSGLHLLMGDASGFVREYAYQGGEYVKVKQFSAADGPVDGLSAGPGGTLWLGASGKMRLVSKNGGLRYETIDLGGSAGRRVVRHKGLGLDLTAGSRGLHGIDYKAL